MARRTMHDDIREHIANVSKNIDRLKDSNDLTVVKYGKCSGKYSGYFVSIYSKNMYEVSGVGINTYTKAGARFLARQYHTLLNVPIESDWD